MYVHGPSPVNGPFKPLFLKAFCKFSVEIVPNPCVKASDIESFTVSSSCDTPVLFFASDALFSMLFCPVSIVMLIAARISNTIIVTIKAIKVIPLMLFFSIFIIDFILSFIYLYYLHIAINVYFYVLVYFKYSILKYHFQLIFKNVKYSKNLCNKFVIFNELIF